MASFTKAQTQHNGEVLLTLLSLEAFFLFSGNLITGTCAKQSCSSYCVVCHDQAAVSLITSQVVWGMPFKSFDCSNHLGSNLVHRRQLQSSASGSLARLQSESFIAHANTEAISEIISYGQLILKQLKYQHVCSARVAFQICRHKVCSVLLLQKVKSYRDDTSIFV